MERLSVCAVSVVLHVAGDNSPVAAEVAVILPVVFVVVRRVNPHHVSRQRDVGAVWCPEGTDGC